jgi:hypothetical protein
MRGHNTALGIYRDTLGLGSELSHSPVSSWTKANGRRTSNPVVGVGGDEKPRRDVSGISHG